MLKNLRLKLSSLGLRQVRRVIVFVFGITVLLIGLALLVLPGPGILVLFAALAILGLEFKWARRWLRKAKGMLNKVTNGGNSPSQRK
jgi:tellurite resistance protein TerC